MALSVGVLIIGSLYWDTTGGRVRWRAERLEKDREWLVKAPIRYGRFADQRGTYTMVFSSLPDDQLGHAKVVQCRKTVSTLRDLVEEAEWLWAAESKSPRNRNISSGWGCVALLCHPERRIPLDFLEGWARHVAANSGADSARLVNDRGILQISWPVLVDGSGLNPLDLLLATSNSPKPLPPPDPAVEAIACGFRAKDEYFRENRRNGIQTFQDDDIIRVMSSGTK
jgi:hypothetical protein